MRAGKCWAVMGGAWRAYLIIFPFHLQKTGGWVNFVMANQKKRTAAFVFSIQKLVMLALAVDNYTFS